MARHALLIGVSEFTDQRLARLNAPTNDVLALRGILKDNSRGSFDNVELSLNEDFLAVRDHLLRLFHDRAPDDLLLLYYSGHGILGRGNRLFLATSGSNLDKPSDRGISARYIREFIDESRAGQQIVVLDCCHSGAFAEHAKSAVPPLAVTEATFSSRDAGVYVLTATDAQQFAWDGGELRAGDQNAIGFSQFTSWLVDGLEKGEAAPDDEQITMDALYSYLSRRARSESAASSPQRFVQGSVGEVVLSNNPLAGSARFDPEIASALVSADYRLRLGAVAALELLTDGEHAVTARHARLLLQRHLQLERDYQVRAAIAKVLATELKQRSAAARLTEEEKPPAEAARLSEEEKPRAETAPPGEEENWRTAPAPLQLAGTGPRAIQGHLGLGVSEGAEPVSRSVASKWRLPAFGVYIFYFLLWPIYVHRFPTLLRSFILIIWMSFWLFTLHLAYVEVTGGLVKVTQLPIKAAEEQSPATAPAKVAAEESAAKQSAGSTPLPSAPPPTSPYEKGLADWAAWQRWYDSLSGDFQKGASWWAAERNRQRRPCEGPDSAGNGQFIQGCNAAKEYLVEDYQYRQLPKDNPDRAEYLKGWNAATNAASSPTLPSASPSLSASASTSPYEKGSADWTAWQQWYDGLSGDFQKGASWWAAERNWQRRPCEGPDSAGNETVYSRL